MFIGHYGAGLGAKGVDKKVSLGTLFLAAQFIDLLWPLFLLFGLEKVKIDPGNTAFTPLDFVYYPFSHSFLAVLIWSIAFGLVYLLIRRNIKGAILLGFLVLSHWILDLITHRPDLPLTVWSDMKVGMGLWNSVFFTLIVEVGIFLVGSFVYFKTTKTKNKKGTYALIGLLLFLLLVYVANILGPPPPEIKVIAYAGLAQWLVVGWAYWIDRNRLAA